MGTLVTYFCPDLDPSGAGSSRNALKHVRAMSVFIPTKFCKHPLYGSVVKADNTEPEKFSNTL